MQNNVCSLNITLDGGFSPADFAQGKSEMVQRKKSELQSFMFSVSLCKSAPDNRLFASSGITRGLRNTHAAPEYPRQG